jgi:hypothetical protein
MFAILLKILFYFSIGLLVVSSIVIVFAYCSLYYTLTEKELFIFYLWGKKPVVSIPISDIASVERTYKIYNAPACSMKRLHIRLTKGHKWNPVGPAWYFHPFISPVREQEFLEMLKAFNPEIEIRVNDKKAWYRFWDWDI